MDMHGILPQRACNRHSDARCMRPVAACIVLHIHVQLHRQALLRALHALLPCSALCVPHQVHNLWRRLRHSCRDIRILSYSVTSPRRLQLE